MAVAERLLAVLRMAVGLGTLWLLASWLPEFGLFFSNSGPLNLSTLAVDTPQGRVAWSLYNVSTAFWWPYLLFLVTAMAALGVALGWHCSLSGPLLALAFWSLQSRTAVTTDAFDRALWLGIAVGVTLPWERAWSLGPQRERSVRANLVSLGTVMLLAFAMVKPSGELAGFLALGPKASPLPDGVWYVALAEDDSGQRWNALDQSVARWDDPQALNLSPRERLYQGRWEDQGYKGTATWWAYRLFHDPKNVRGGKRPQAVKLYRCSSRAKEPPYRLVAVWPLGRSDGLGSPFHQDTP